VVKLKGSNIKIIPTLIALKLKTCELLITKPPDALVLFMFTWVLASSDVQVTAEKCLFLFRKSCFECLMFTDNCKLLLKLVVWIPKIKGTKINLHVNFPAFRAAKLKSFTVLPITVNARGYPPLHLRRFRLGAVAG